MPDQGKLLFKAKNLTKQIGFVWFVSYASVQAWVGMTFAHLGLGMGNGKAHSKLLGLGMKNPIPNLWDKEWESKIQLPIFVIRNGNKKHSSQPNLEIIYKRVSGKTRSLAHAFPVGNRPTWFNYTAKYSKYIFKKLGLEIWMKNGFPQFCNWEWELKSVPEFWVWEWEWKIVVPTQLGKEFSKGYM